MKTPPALAKVIEERAAEIAAEQGFEGRIQVAGDSTLSGADCRIEWRGGGVERSQRDDRRRIGGSDRAPFRTRRRFAEQGVVMAGNDDVSICPISATLTSGRKAGQPLLDKARPSDVEPKSHGDRSRSGLRRAGHGSAILGKSAMEVSQLLKLGKGTVVELDRKVGEAIDIYVNDRLVARGEVVLVEDRLGVTMTEIIKAGQA